MLHHEGTEQQESVGIPVEDAGYDVFLSHNSVDKAVVEQLARRLEADGVSVFFDMWHLVPGERWQPAIERALAASRTLVVCLGADGLGAWSDEELRVGLERQATDPRFRVIPVLLPSGAEVPPEKQLPPFLRGRTWVRFDRSIEDRNAYERLRHGVEGVASAPIFPTPGLCPYRGLEPFDTEHAELFFGRDELVQSLVDAVERHPFLCVLGPSGSGKSSAVRAGLLPRLAADALPGSASWPTVVFRPGSAPLQALAGQLNQLLPAADYELPDKLRTRPDLLRSIASSLPAVVRAPDCRLLIVVDQFEEAYTACRDQDERRAFVAQLLRASTAPESRAVVVITLRVDFYPHLYQDPDLIEQVSKHQLPVREIDEAATRAIITEPARRAGLTLDPGLTEVILDDLSGESDALPLLEYTLLRLWERREGSRLTLAAYAEIGGLRGAISQRADDLFSAFEPTEQAAARRVLLRMVRPGEGTMDTRRSIRVDDLSPVDSEVLSKLVSARLVTTDNTETSQTTADVAHEALIRGWPTLRQWIETSRDQLRLHAQITELANEWKDAGRPRRRLRRFGSGGGSDSAYLLRGSRLREAVALRETIGVEFTDLEAGYVAESERARRRARLASSAAMIALVVLAGVATAGFLVARRTASAARDGEQFARSGELAATALLTRGDRDLPSLLGLQALRLASRPESFRAVAELLASADRPIHTLFRSPAMMYAVAYDADRGGVAIGGNDGKIRVLDEKTDAVRWETEAHEGWVRRLAFSPDGSVLASAAFYFPPSELQDKSVRLWDAATGAPLGTGVALNDAGQPTRVGSIAFLPDGTLMTSHGDGKVRTWRRTGTELVATVAHITGKDSLASLAVDAKGRYVASSSSKALGTFTKDGQENFDTSIFLWEVGRVDPVRVVGGLSVAVQDLAIDPTGTWLAAAGQDGRIRIIRLEDGAYIGDLTGHSGMVITVAFNDSGTLLASGSMDGRIGVWDMTVARPDGGQGMQRRMLSGSTDWVWGVTFSDERTIYSASADKAIRRWDARGSSDTVELGRLSSSATGPEFVAGGSVIVAIATGARQLVAWDVGSGEQRYRIEAETPPTEAWQTAIRTNGWVWPDRLAVDKDGTTLAWAGDDGRIRFYDAATGASTGAAVGPLPGIVARLAFDPSGSLLAASSDIGTVAVFDVASGREVLRLAGNQDGVRIGFFPAVAFSPDGATFLATAFPGELRRFTTSSWAEAPRLSVTPVMLTDLAYSPDGRQVVTAADDGTITFWSAASWERLFTPALDHTGPVVNVAFDPSGRVLASAGYDGLVRLWSTSTGRFLSLGSAPELGGATDYIFPTGVRFSPDGRRLARTASDGSVTLVAVGGDVAELACRTAGRNLSKAEWDTFIGGPYVRLCPDLPVGTGAPEDAPVARNLDRLAEDAFRS